MNDWKQFNEEVSQLIEQPTRKQMLEMDELHLALYEFHQEKKALTKSLEEVTEQIKRYSEKLIDRINSDDPPNWAWKWNFKKSSIKWKQEFIDRLGKAEANKVSAIAKQKTYPKIGVRFIDPNPEDIPENPIQSKSVKRLTLPEAPKLTLKERLAQQKGK